MKAYNGGYSEFLKRKALDREIEEKHYALAQKEIRRMEAMITEFRRWNRERSIRTAESKEKQLNKFKQSAPGRPENAPQALRFSLHADTEGGNDVLICRGLTKTFDRPLFHDIDLHIRRGERVFIIGPNGCGKSTLMRLIMNQVPPAKGEVVFGTRIQPTYYDQHQRSLHMDWTPCKEIENAYPAMNETQVRTVLGSFLFRGDDVFKPVSALSGGERARIELLKMMLSGANFLLLDEPTNHLDAPSREALEEALVDYEGPVLAISHDRYLINRLATRVLVMQNGTLRESIGNYDDYLRHAEEWKTAEVVPEAPKKVPGAGRALRESGAALRRMRAQLRKTEDEIETLEGEIETLEARLADPAVAADYQAILSLTEEIEQRRTLLSQTMQRWEELSLSLDGADEG